MRKCITAFISILIASSLYGLADNIPLTKYPQDPLPPPDKGTRKPTGQISCDIDFTLGTITGVSSVMAYQLWDASRSILICESEDDTDFVLQVKNHPAGTYILHLICDGYCLEGILVLT